MTLSRDVVVVGGGFAGLAASLAASASGATTALLEQCSEPGGNVTQAYVHTICGLFELESDSPSYVHDGLPKVFSRQLIDDGLGASPVSVGEVYVQPIYPQSMGKYLGDHLREQENLNLKVNHEVSSSESTNGLLKITGRDASSGTNFTLETKTVIDTSGDAITAPDPAETSTEELQLPSLIFLVEGIDDELTSGYGKLHLNRHLASGVKEGELPPGCESILVRPGRYPGQAYITLNLPRDMVDRYDPFDESALSAFENEARRRASLVVGYLREQRDELSDLSISHFPPRIGIRETRRVPTQYTITESDVLEGRSFDGAVAKSAWPIELWEEYTSAELQYPEDVMDVPLEALLADYDPRIGTAGRCLGATHRAAAALRVLGTALSTGQAIGTAAALAAENETTLEDVEPRAVRQRIDEIDWEQVCW